LVQQKSLKMEKTHRISVIVPVYNVEKYLARCIDSILAQTFADFECILIDDGSSDNSPAICDEYAKKDDRIKVIHKENGGVSSARNTGLDVAQGEWITFIDSDDWVENNILDLLLNNAVKNNCDMSVCGLRSLDENEKELSKSKQMPLETLDKNTAKKTLLGFEKFTSCVVGKIVKKEYAGKVRFRLEIKVCEDGLFWFEIIDNIDNLIYDSTPCYNYLQTENSLTRSKKAIENYKDVFIATQKMLELEKNKSIKRKIKSYEASIANGWCYLMIKSGAFDKEYYLYYSRIVIKNILFYFLDNNIPLKHKIMAILTLFPFLYKKLILLVKSKGRF